MGEDYEFRNIRHSDTLAPQSLDTLDRTVMSASVKARKPA